MKSRRTAAFLSRYAMPLVLLLLVVLMVALRPEAKLLAWENVKTILLQASVLAFIALGLTFVMLAGETDISFAGTLGMMSAAFTLLTNGGSTYFAALAIVILIGILIGVLVALLVTRSGFSAFIVSISFMFMGLGIERGFNEGVTIWLKGDAVKAIGRMQFGNMYVFSWLMIALYLAAFLSVRFTRYGFHLRIIGENRLAGIEAGIKDRSVKVTAFVLAGALFALASTVEPIRFGGSIVGAGQSYMLPALAACYLGSTMFTPGRVNIAGTLIGALFMNIISNFMQLMNMQYYFTPFVQGLVLLVAVGVSVFRNRQTIQQVLV